MAGVLWKEVSDSVGPLGARWWQWCAGVHGIRRCRHPQLHTDIKSFRELERCICGLEGLKWMDRVGPCGVLDLSLSVAQPQNMPLSKRSLPVSLPSLEPHSVVASCAGAGCCWELPVKTYLHRMRDIKRINICS